MGDDAWRYQPHSEDDDGIEAANSKKAEVVHEKTAPVGRDKSGATEGEPEQQVGHATVAELKRMIYKLAGQEDR